MDINTVHKILQDSMVEYEEWETIDTDKLWDLSIKIGTNKGVKKVGGTYHPHYKLITINLHVLLASRNNEQSIKLLTNVIRHELAHHIDYIHRGKTDHSKPFKEICKALGVIDYNATTPYSSDIFKD